MGFDISQIGGLIKEGRKNLAKNNIFVMTGTEKKLPKFAQQLIGIANTTANVVNAVGDAITSYVRSGLPTGTKADYDAYEKAGGVTDGKFSIWDKYKKNTSAKLDFGGTSEGSGVSISNPVVKKVAGWGSLGLLLLFVGIPAFRNAGNKGKKSKVVK